MTAVLLDGEVLAARIRAEVAERVARLNDEGVRVGLGTILVGDDGPSARYVAMKHEDCGEVGIASFNQHLPATATQADVESAVRRFNDDPAVHAYLVQLPLPGGLDEERVLLAVDPTKDVDGLHPVNLGKLVMGTAGPAALHPGRHRRAPPRPRRPGRGPPRRHHRPGAHHRPPAGRAPRLQAPGLQRRGHRRPHRGGRHGRPSCARATWWWPRRAGPGW